MIINTHMIGTLIAVRKVEIGEFVDGNWENEVPKVELTVMSEGLDLENQKNVSVTKEFLDSKLFSKFEPLTGKHLAIPYKLETKKKGQSFEYDSEMPILELTGGLSTFIKADKK